MLRKRKTIFSLIAVIYSFILISIPVGVYLVQRPQTITSKASLVTPSPTPITLNPTARAAGYTFVWGDEFNGTSLDTTKWIAVTNCGDKRNNELQCYTADDVSVAGGNLVIKSERRSLGGFNYTSGAVKTGDKFTKAYGRFEISAQLPQKSGNGTQDGIWPALWMYPVRTWPPEIDILEVLYNAPMNKIYMTNHWGTPQTHQAASSYFADANLATGFHIYALEWEPTEIRWYVDDVLRNTYNGPYVPSIPMQIYLNLALGSGIGSGRVNTTTVLPQYFKIDYVRVYDKSAPTCTEAHPSAATTTATSGIFRVYATGVRNATAVLFPTWSEVNGQDDLIWYPGTNLGGGTWYADIDLAKHPGSGWIRVHTYMYNSSYTNQFCHAADFQRLAPTHCNRCSTVSANQRVDFNSEDSTCAKVVPSTNPVTRTCDCSCPSAGLNTTLDSACISSCITLTASPVPTPTPASLLINGGFENGLTGWRCSGAKNGTCSTDSSIKHSGGYSALVTNTGGDWGWQINQTNIAVSQGEQICLSGWVKKNNSSDQVGIALQQGSSPWQEVPLLSTYQDQDWHLLNQTIQVGSNWLSAQVFARVWTAGGKVWFDDIVLTRGTCK